MGFAMQRTAVIAACAALVFHAGATLAHDEPHHQDGRAGRVPAKDTAFGRAADPAKAQKTILVEMRDPHQFAPDVVEVRTGEIIRFVAVNAGSQMHEMVLGTKKELEEHNQLMRNSPKGMHHDEPHMAHVAPGKSGVIAWQFTRPGEFFFGCLVDDHFEKGMIGTIRVTGEPLAEAGAHAGHAAGHGEHAPEMKAAYGPYPMTREASGTSWQPDSSPHQGIHARLGAWDTMTHGFANLVYDDQGGARGHTKAFVHSRFMLVGNRAVGEGGTLGLRAMLSADPAWGKGGYPLLLQTGETGDGQTPLIDRQHPHDLFMELAASYSQRLSERSSLFVYIGLPGEPALG